MRQRLLQPLRSHACMPDLLMLRAQYTTQTAAGRLGKAAGRRVLPRTHPTTCMTDTGCCGRMRGGARLAAGVRVFTELHVLTAHEAVDGAQHDVQAVDAAGKGVVQGALVRVAGERRAGAHAAGIGVGAWPAGRWGGCADHRQAWAAEGRADGRPAAEAGGGGASGEAARFASRQDWRQRVRVRRGVRIRVCEALVNVSEDVVVRRRRRRGHTPRLLACHLQRPDPPCLVLASHRRRVLVHQVGLHAAESTSPHRTPQQGMPRSCRPADMRLRMHTCAHA